MSCERGKHLPGGDVPDAGGCVVRRRDGRGAIGAEGGGAYRSFMSCERGKHLPGGDIPEAGGVVI